MQTNRSNNIGALIGGALLIGFGLLSLMGRVFRGLDWGLLWPFVIIGFGALFFVLMFATGRSGAAFAVPGQPALRVCRSATVVRIEYLPFGGWASAFARP